MSGAKRWAGSKKAKRCVALLIARFVFLSVDRLVWLVRWSIFIWWHGLEQQMENETVSAFGGWEEKIGYLKSFWWWCFFLKRAGRKLDKALDKHRNTHREYHTLSSLNPSTDFSKTDPTKSLLDLGRFWNCTNVWFDIVENIFNWKHKSQVLNAFGYSG